MNKNFLLIILLSLLVTGTATVVPVTYVCKYEKYSNKEGSQKAKDFILTFVDDIENEKAYIVSNRGSNPVVPVRSMHPGSVTFIEITNSGNVMTTAIDASMESVHSRSTIMSGEIKDGKLGGKIVSSQYYGKCVIK